MIGSNTMLVKENGKYRVHVCGMFFLSMVVDPFNAFKQAEKDWGVPDQDNLTQDEVNEILHSHQCANKSQPFYSKFAGDCVLFLDLDSGKLNTRAFAKPEAREPHPWGLGEPLHYGSEYWTEYVPK